MTILKFIHSYWAYLVVLTVAWTSINSTIGFFTKRAFSGKDFKWALFGMVTTHMQVMLGLFYYLFANDFGDVPIGVIMKEYFLRLKNVEHPLLMFLTVALVTIFYSKHKKARTSHQKFKLLSIGYTIAIILILAMIPWHIWI